METVKKYLKIFKQSGVKFFEINPMHYSASIAFYTIFSMPAILIIVVVIAGSAYEDQAVRTSLLEQIEYLVGSEGADEVEKILQNASQSASSVFAKIVGIGTLIFSATTVFVSLQEGLNRIWGIRPKPERGIVKFIIDRLLSLAMVGSIGFLLLVSLITDTLLVVFRNFLTMFLSSYTYYVISIFNVVLSLSIITLIFAIIFKVLPDAKIKWRNVWVGAIVTTLLFTLGKYLIGLYLGSSSVGSAYGAAGSLVLLLIWVYYSSILVLFGAQFTYVYSQEMGEKILPARNAVKIKIEEIEKEEETVES